jgi:regulator of RNase E activity RraB
MKTHDQKINEFTQHMIDALDLDSLIVIAFDALRENYKTYSPEELENEIREYAPHLIEN